MAVEGRRARVDAHLTAGRALIAGGKTSLVVVAVCVLVQRLLLPFAALHLAARTPAILALLAAAVLGFVRALAAHRLAGRVRQNLLEMFLGPFVRGPAPALPLAETVTARLATEMPVLIRWAVDGIALVLAATVAIPAVVALLAVNLGARVLVPIGLAGLVGAAATLLATRRVVAAWNEAWARATALLTSASAGYRGAFDLRAHGRAAAYAERLRGEMRAWWMAEGRAHLASTTSTWGAFALTLATAAAVVALSNGALEPQGDPYKMSLLVLAAVPTLHTLISGVGNVLAARGALAAAARQLALAEEARDVEGDEPIDAAAEIRLEGVGYTYPPREGEASPAVALRGADLVLPPRGSLAIVGPNAAGKTTLAHVLLGVVRPQRGRTLVGGRDVSLDNRGFHASVAYLAQRPFEVPEGTIAQNLRVFDETLPDHQLLAALGTVGLRESLLARAGTEAGVLGLRCDALSSGQRRRVMLARTLLRKADLLVLDEPEAHLDAAGAAELAAILRRIAAERRVVAVIHDRQILGFADQVIELTAPEASSP